MKVVSVSILFLTFVINSLALPNGASPRACESLTPRHGGNKPQSSPSPYVVEVSPLESRSYRITIRGESPETTLKGFILQARDASNTSHYETFGSFESTDSNSKEITCRAPNDTATHTNNSPKGQVTFQWNAPATGSGTVKFVGAIVHDFEHFYTNQMSHDLTY